MKLEFNATLKLKMDGLVRISETSSFYSEVMALKMPTYFHEKDLKEFFIWSIQIALNDPSCRGVNEVVRAPGKFTQPRF